MAKGERFAFLDVVRGLAVIWMIQVHVTNVVLDPSLRVGWFFDALNISNGFVAPTFIFCAGAGLWIALSRKGPTYRLFGSELFTYLRRLSYILVWAYVLHAPFFSLDRLLMS
ncbi:MAG: heparan-alpha-glucosaminide N-acetyltransferase domain-containing protein, partial [Candidatus Kapabacteria bacterium]|nr:heparan-alpha-glucosaminide N-acetyltransferase domain-containing protein [Candidatus Kapabacteria bacterium]